MKLSVIICTYNREKYIYNVLKSIADNDFPRNEYEILLIDNNCTDNTRGVCSNFQRDYPDMDFKYIEEKAQGLSHARNRGIKESSFGIVVYVDDDAMVNRNYLRSYSDFFEKNKKGMAAGGPIIPIYETAEPEWMSFYAKQLLTAYLYKGDKMCEFKRGQFPGGGNAAYRKKVFEIVGLFNTELGRRGNSLSGAEEKDLFDRMRHLEMKIHYLPQSILYHIIPAQKLTSEYFNSLTVSIGKSERKRTLAVSKWKYAKRILAETVKWCATIFLLCVYILKFAPQKGLKLVHFRWNVTKGLINK